MTTVNTIGVHVKKVLKSALFLAVLLGAFTGMAVGSGPIMGTASVQVTQTRLKIEAPATISAGLPFPVQVTAVDDHGVPLSHFRDKVHWTSSDATATLPADYTFVNPSYRFQITLRGTGPQTITLTDVSGQAIAGATTTTVGG